MPGKYILVKPRLGEVARQGRAAGSDGATCTARRSWGRVLVNGSENVGRYCGCSQPWSSSRLLCHFWGANRTPRGSPGEFDVPPPRVRHYFILASPDSSGPARPCTPNGVWGSVIRTQAGSKTRRPPWGAGSSTSRSEPSAAIVRAASPSATQRATSGASAPTGGPDSC
jgi:hypothetical protein